jgi:repressor LexA
MNLVLYKRQRDILDFLRKFIAANGFAPTIREIAAGIGIKSPATIEEHLQTLEHKGVISRIRGKRRAIAINPGFSPKPHDSIPIMGQIAAGEPIEAIEDRTDSVDFPVSGDVDRHFALRVKGDSMIEDGIFDGDIVVIRKQNNCSNGEVVVALVDNNNATLKRLYHERNRIRLQPANSRLSPIYVHDVLIQGIVVGLVRRF